MFFNARSFRSHLSSFAKFSVILPGSGLRPGLLAVLLASFAATGYAASTADITLSTTSLGFGTVALNTSTSKSVTVTSSGTAPLIITNGSLTGSRFSIAGETLPPSVRPSLPITLTPGETITIDIGFDTTAAGAASGKLTIVSNAGTATVALSGTGESATSESAANLSEVTCSSGAVTGAGTDACTVSLTSAAASGGVSVDLASNSSSLKVPASVTVASGSTNASFTATATAVSTAQTATITASAGSVSKTASVQLDVAAAKLSVSPTTVAFGNVDLNTTATQSVVLTSSGSESLTIGSADLSGAGFSTAGVTFPLTLEAGKTATLDITFDPKTAGAVSGAISLASNSSAGTVKMSLTGTGTAASYSVDLKWDAPGSSSEPVVGYKVYRATGGGGFEPLDTTSDTLTYTDTTVASGTSYSYEVMSVDSEGSESSPSNTYTVAIP